MAEARVAITLEAMDKTRPALESARRNLQGFQQQAQQTGIRVRQAMSTAMTGMTMAASSALALYNAYDALGPVQARLIRLQARRQATEAAIINYQRMLNKLVEEGKKGTERYTYYQMQLAAAQERLRATTLMLEDAQDEMAKAYIRIALSAVPMLTMALNKLSLTTVRQVIPAIRGMTVAFMTSPIGIITVAITGLIAVLGYVTRGFKDWTVVTEALNTALRAVLWPLASFLDWVGNFIPQARDWAEALRGVKVDLSGLSVVGETIDSLTGSLIPAVQASADLHEVTSQLASNLPALQSNVDEAASSLASLGDTGWEAQGSMLQLNSALQEVESQLDMTALAAENAWDALAPDPAQVSQVYKQMGNELRDLRGLLFECAIKPSEKFQASLRETAEVVWEQLKTRGVSSLEDLRNAINEFAAEWGLTWSEALSLIRGEIDRLGEEAKAKAQEAGKAIENALAKWRQLGARPLPESALARIRGIPPGEQRGQAYLTQAISAFHRGEIAEAARWAYAAAAHGYAFPPELRRWAAQHPAEWVEIWKGIRGAQYGGVFTRPTLTLLAERGPEAVIPLERLPPTPQTVNIKIDVERMEGPADEVRLAKRVGVEVVEALSRKSGGI